jgi:hypothetical protein
MYLSNEGGAILERSSMLGLTKAQKMFRVVAVDCDSQFRASGSR